MKKHRGTVYEERLQERDITSGKLPGQVLSGTGNVSAHGDVGGFLVWRQEHEERHREKTVWSNAGATE